MGTSLLPAPKAECPKDGCYRSFLECAECDFCEGIKQIDGSTPFKQLNKVILQYESVRCSYVKNTECPKCHGTSEWMVEINGAFFPTLCDCQETKLLPFYKVVRCFVSKEEINMENYCRNCHYYRDPVGLTNRMGIMGICEYKLDKAEATPPKLGGVYKPKPRSSNYSTLNK